MIVSAQQKRLCYEIANNHTLGKRLFPERARTLIADKAVEAFESKMNLDSSEFTALDQEVITNKIKGDPEVKQFVFIPIIMSAVLGWIVQTILQSLWDWYKNSKTTPSQ